MPDSESDHWLIVHFHSVRHDHRSPRLTHNKGQQLRAWPWRRDTSECEIEHGFDLLHEGLLIVALESPSVLTVERKHRRRSMRHWTQWHGGTGSNPDG